MKNARSASCTLSLLVLAVLAVVAVLSLDPQSVAAQYPRPKHRPLSTPDISKHLTSGRFTRIVVVDSGGGGDFKKLSDALAYVATKNSSERNWTSRWTVLVYPGQRGSADPDTFGPNYSETSLTIPAYTEVLGFATGRNSPIAWMGGVPVIELRATSGTLVRLGGGSSLSNLHFVWVQTPATAVKALDHTTVPDSDPKNDHVSSLGHLTNVSFQLVARNNSSFSVDGITESSGGLLVYGGGVMVSGSASGHPVVNAGTVAGLGVSLHGGRYGGSGCAAAMANKAAGSLKLYSGVNAVSRSCL